MSHHLHFFIECLVLIWSSLTCHFCSLRVSTSHKVFLVITIQEMGVYRVFQLDFVSHGQSNVEKTSKQFTCSYKFIKLDIHATSQKYRVTLQEQNWYTMVSLPNTCYLVLLVFQCSSHRILCQLHWPGGHMIKDDTLRYFQVLPGTMCILRYF